MCQLIQLRAIPSKYIGGQEGISKIYYAWVAFSMGGCDHVKNMLWLGGQI